MRSWLLAIYLVSSTMCANAPFASLADSDQFIRSLSVSGPMYATVEPMSLDLIDLTTYIATTPFPGGRIVACCPYTATNTAMTCVGAPDTSTSTLIILETLATVTTTPVGWSMVGFGDFLLGGSTDSPIGNALDSGSSSAVVGGIIIAILVVIGIILLCVCQRRSNRAREEEASFRRSNLPQLRSEAPRRNERAQSRSDMPPEVRYAEVPRPGTNSLDMNSPNDALEMVDVARNTARSLAAPRPVQSIANVDATAQRVTTSSLESSAPHAQRSRLHTAMREADPEPSFADVIPSTSLFAQQDESSNANKGDDFWAP